MATIAYKIIEKTREGNIPLWPTGGVIFLRDGDIIQNYCNSER